MSPFTPFTGNKCHRVTHKAGKAGGRPCLSAVGGAMIQGDLGRSGQGHRRHNILRTAVPVLIFYCLIVIIGTESVFAHDGELFQAQITQLEKLFTGGYMRLGLLAICGVTAVAGAIKQNGMVFLTGILSGVFAYFMRDWIQSTFACVV